MKTSIIAIFILFFIGVLYTEYISIDEVQIVVTDKERITTGSGENISSKFLVYTDGEVFENTDSILFFKFRSADLQNQLKVDSSYTVKVNGFRIPVISSFRNILEIVE